MAKVTLKRLTVAALRGAVLPFSINFEANKNLALIYGENGTGKTTLCDALDLIGNGKVGSLENRGLGGALSSYWASVGKSKADIKVEVETSGGTWAATVGAKGAVVTPAASQLQVEVLRRSQLTQLVQHAPSDRYEVIRPFVDISGVEASENQLRDLIREKKKQLTEASAVIAENQAAIEDMWKLAGVPTSGAIVWARAETKKDHAALADTSDKLRAAVTSLSLLEQQIEQLGASATLLDSERTRLAQAESLLAKTQTTALDDSSIVGILMAAKIHFETDGKDHPEKCPLCHSSEFAANLPANVDERLSLLNALKEAMQEKSAAEKKLGAAESAHHLNAQTLHDNIAKAMVALDELNGEADVAAAISSSGWMEMSQAGGSNTAGLLVAVQELQAALKEISARKEQARAQFAHLRLALQRYEANMASQQELAVVMPFLERALVICEQERKKFVDGLLAQIANDVGLLYEGLHPGEGLNKISLKLHPTRRASLELGAKFLSLPEVPPHAYFSESHLDSLGLCIFLALARLKGASETILVLDDVLGSIDEPHVDRLIHLLYDEAANFQHCIVTTHYRPWKEKFRWGWLKNGQCQLIELKGWNSQQGLMVSQGIATPIAELGGLLAVSPPSPQLACGSAGVVLEAVCDFLVDRYECSVPRRKGKLTLGDLLPAIDKKLKPSLRVECKQSDGSYQSIGLGDKFDELQQMASLRNIFGCHFNDMANHLPEQDAIRFAQIVHEVASALVCPDEGWPASDKSGSWWATRSDSRRLHPLKRPG